MPNKPHFLNPHAVSPKAHFGAVREVLRLLIPLSNVSNMVWVKTEQNRRMDRNRAYIMVVGTSGPSNPFLAGGFHEYFYVQPLHGMIDPTK